MSELELSKVGEDLVFTAIKDGEIDLTFAETMDVQISHSTAKKPYKLKFKDGIGEIKMKDDFPTWDFDIDTMLTWIRFIPSQYNDKFNDNPKIK